MAQYGPVPTGKYRGPPMTLSRRGRMTHRKDAAVQPMHPPGGEPVVDDAIAEPDLAQLSPADHAVLSTREPGNADIPMTSPQFKTTVVANCGHGGTVARERSRRACGW